MATPTDLRDTGAPDRGAPDRGARGRQPARRVKVVLVVAVLTVGAYWAGAQSPWIPHRPHTVSGTAERLPVNVPVGGHKVGDDDLLWFALDDVVWRDGNRSDDGSVPRCLREVGEKVPVEATVIELARPWGSGSYEKVVSVTCLGPR